MTEPSGFSGFRIVRTTSFGPAVGLVLGALVLAGCSSSQFQDEDEMNVPLDSSIMKSIMTGMGAVDPNRKAVSVEPRAPLAIPPDTKRLPTPEDGPKTDKVGGNFPVNPEDTRREMMAAGAAAEAARGEDRMSQSELQAGRIAGAGLHSQVPVEDLEKPMTPDKLKNSGFKVPDAVPKNPDGTPVRRSLTEPPTDYRKPASTAPMDPPEEKKASWYKPGTWFNGVRNRHDDMPEAKAPQ
ncbi:hypothetical protein ACRC7T_12590 [Segnochrobactraceae bacterium EtOH-i3]